MSTSEGVDVVYGVHAFEAENPDELSFGAGERIVVLEKDDQYQDGWWQGVNTKGERGLFPQTYTQSSPPTVVTSTPVVAQDGFTQAAAVEKPRSRSPSPTRPAETPEMRATIDDIQSHLDGMYVGKETSAVAALPGTVAPVREENEPKALASVPAASDTSSVASASIRDDASSVLDRDLEETEASGDIMASHAKDNLARNIQLAQEREEKKRVADERAREAERERMRMASSQPVEGLVFSDESDAESAVGDESDGDDDSIFPTKRQVAEEQDTFQYASVPQDTQTDEASRTPQLGTRGDRTSVSTATGLPAPLGDSAAAQTTEQQPHLYLVDRPAQLEHQDSDAPSSYQATPLQSPPVAQAPEAPVYATSPLNDSPEDVLAPPPAAETNAVAAPEPASASQTITSVSQPTRHPGGRRSIDAGVAPGEAGLISLVEQAATSPTPAAYTFPAQSPAPIQTGAPQYATYTTTQPQPASPHPSNAASSRPSSTLGTAFTPATSAPNYLDSPRSGTFGGSRNSNQSDPRDWSVDQVVEWGQSRNFDASILAKFREHEISGDVLLDMDINSLKEIDIIAFGPRARIAKAIKDLRAQFDMTTSLSPSLSGYDSGPGSLAATSPAVNSLREGSFAPSSSLPTTYESDGQTTKATMSTQAPTTPDLASSSAASNVQDDYLRGLGLGQASSATAAPSTRQPSQAPSSPAPFTESVVPKPTDTPKTTRTRHTTGGTEDSFETAEDMRDEAASTTPSDSTEAASRSERKPKTSLGSFRTRDRQKSSGPSTSAVGTSPGGPTSPEIGSEGAKYGKSAGRNFFSSTLGRSRKPPPTYTGESSATPAATSTTTTERSSGMQRSPSSNTGNRLSARLFGIGNSQSGTGQATVASGSGHERGKRSISLPLEAGAPVKSPTIPEEAVAAPASSARNTPRPSAPATRGSREAVPTAATTAVPAAGALATTSGGVRAVDKIGEADYAGYLRKRSDRYNSWKERYLVLKGTYLYVLKSPTEDKVKHYINLVGYRFVSDGSVGSGLGDRGRYGFKATHPTEQTHYFSSGDSVTTRNWMKAFLKVTIGRDYSAPVTSSSNIKTIPLSVAQSMNPPPRPPSPTSAVRVQKASLTSNPNTLSATDAAKLMGASVLPASGAMDRGGSMQSNGKSPPVSPNKRKNSSFLPPLKSSQRKKPVSEDYTDPKRSPTSVFGNFEERPPSSLGRNERRSSWYGKALGGGSSSASPKASMDNPSFSPNSSVGPAAGQGQSNTLSPVMSGVAAGSPQGVDRRPSAMSTFTMNPSQELLDWVNDHLPNGTAKAFEWSDMSSGRIYTRLVEHLGGKKSGIEEAAFDKFRPLQPGRTPDMDYIDTLFRCFDFLLDRGVKTDDVSINDLMTGNQPHLIKLAEIIRTRFET